MKFNNKIAVSKDTLKNSHSFIPVIIKNIAVAAFAFTCGFYFTSLFHEPTSLIGGLWAVMAAIMVIEASHKETFTAAKKWIIGSLIGAAISGIFLLFFSFTILGFVITIGIGALICLLLGFPQSIKLTGITISAVVIVSAISKDLHPFANSGLRLSESIIGAGTAVLVAYMFYSIGDIMNKNPVKK